jgi:hypothetical protein
MGVFKIARPLGLAQHYGVSDKPEFGLFYSVSPQVTLHQYVPAKVQETFENVFVFFFLGLGLKRANGTVMTLM